MKSVELFTGAGGIALGLSLAGFVHKIVVERDHAACETIRENKKQGVIDWPLVDHDVSHVNFRPFRGSIDLLAGGPPCQPFSLASSVRAHADDRNLFPEFARAARELSPKAILVENVPGIMRGRLSRYFEYIVLQLRFPELVKRRGEAWPSHKLRLERCATSRSVSRGLTYEVWSHVLQAADFGVPQRRERVFIVAFRSDLGVSWSFPIPTHSLESLVWDQWVSGAYWDRHGIPVRVRPKIPITLRSMLARLRVEGRPSELPWRTVRDAILDLPEPRLVGNASAIPNHVLIPGARLYKKHTGSPPDLPAKTLKAGVHGVPGGENVLVVPGKVTRYFTIRECARLQTFPDSYRFIGNWKTLVRQLGNAVPVRMTQVLAESIRGKLGGSSSDDMSSPEGNLRRTTERSGPVELSRKAVASTSVPLFQREEADVDEKVPSTRLR